jgi:Flp pilus assembly protein TadB
MFEDLKKNIEQEKKIILDLHSIETSMGMDKANKAFYVSSIQSLVQQLQLLNRAVPSLLKEWSPLKKFVEEDKEKVGEKTIPKPPVVKVKQENPEMVRMSYVSPSTKEKRFVTIDKKDRKKYLEKLRFSESGMAGLRNIEKKQSTEVILSKPSIFAKYANKYFLKYSEKLAPQFIGLEKDLKKSNMGFILKTYLSMALFSSVIAFFVGFLVYGFLLVMSLSNFIHIWIPFVAIVATMFVFYIYPSNEVSSVQKKISQELPFVTIHMAAIAGSNIEPTKIFKIIAFSKEYPTIGTEVKKIVVQTEIYGYDLVTSLKNVARRTSDKQFSELLSGLAANISGGGELKTYLEKKAENFLLDYKLERQKYADLAGTFMDVYISILIAAPLVLMMMFIVMNVAGLGMGTLGITTLLFLSIGGIAIANVVFLVVLNIKQPAV